MKNKKNVSELKDILFQKNVNLFYEGGLYVKFCSLR